MSNLKEEILKPVEKKILDSGERRDFGTGAVRDMSTGKGRFDLCPLDVLDDLIAWFYEKGKVCADLEKDSNLTYTPLQGIQRFMETGEERYLFYALCDFVREQYGEVGVVTNKKHLMKMIFEFSKHMEEGCLKYSDKDSNGKIAPNMMRGIPLHCYIDSGVRHYMKNQDGWVDEPHERAFVWNIIMAIWTKRHIKELDDINYEVYAGKGLKKDG